MLHNNKHYDTKLIMADNPPPSKWFLKGKTIKQWCRKVISEQHQSNQLKRQIAFKQRELAGMLGIDVNEVILALNTMKDETIQDATPIPVIDKPKKRKNWFQRWRSKAMKELVQQDKLIDDDVSVKNS